MIELNVPVEIIDGIRRPKLDAMNVRVLLDMGNSMLVEADVALDRAASESVRAAARTAYATNKSYVQSTPTAAQLAAQVKALTHQVNALVRLLVAQDVIE